jgi:micrococcal nuclease
MNKKLLISIITAIALIVPANSYAATTYYQVTKVADGDTITVKIGKKNVSVRLIGVDTPETVDPRKTVECFGKEASAITKKKLLNKKVALEADPTQGETDKYGRLLRYAFLQDGTNFDKWLISEGYGFEYTYNLPYKYQQEHKDAESAARLSSKGLWKSETCNAETKVKKLPQGQKIETTKTSSTTAPSVQSSQSHAFYVSSQAKTKYYCDTDSAWKNLSPSNLLKFANEQELRAKFPKLTLNKSC